MYLCHSQKGKQMMSVCKEKVFEPLLCTNT